MLSGAEHSMWRIGAKTLSLDVLEDYPTYAITMGGTDNRYWYTIHRSVGERLYGGFVSIPATPSLC